MSDRFVWIKGWSNGVPEKLKSVTSWMCHCYAAFKNPKDFYEHSKRCEVPVPKGWYQGVDDGEWGRS